MQDAFFAAAAASGKPRGLRWKAVEWESAVAFARERATGSLTALAGVVIEFEAVEGGDMEGVEAVGNLRSASAVFFFHAGQWRTTGKTVFNLNPDEVLFVFRVSMNGFERIVDNRDAQRRQFLKPPPAARDAPPLPPPRAPHRETP